MKKISPAFSRSFLISSVILAVGFLTSANVFAEEKTYSVRSEPTGEDYKSFNPNNNFTIGASTGFGLVDTHGGFTLIGNLATKVVRDGFLPEIVNPVFLEVQFGPTFVSNATFWMYSTHLRWDFVKDRNWTFFGLGGFGGNFGNNRYGDRLAVHPRFGVGAFLSLDTVDFRFEFSHEIITVGLSLPF